MPGKPSLDLEAEVTLADGSRYRWDSSAKSAGDRPQDISFRTKKGDGFADASLTLSRRIDQDYVDLNLYDDFALIGYDGSVAYEGRVAANPRSLGQAHQMSVVLQGWMSHAKDKKFSEVYVDRDMSKWGAPVLDEKVRLSLFEDIGSFSWNTDASGLVCALPNVALGANVGNESWYVAPTGVTIAKAMYVGTDTSLPAGWSAPAIDWADTDNATGDLSVSVTLDSTLRTATPATAKRFVFVWMYSNGNARTPAVGANRRYSNLGVYGSHGLTTRTIDSTTPDGVYASDVIANIAQRFCPKLNTSGVQGTTYAIPHLVFDRTFPFDAFLEVNKFHLWNIGVYENKTLQFGPFDYTDYDWEVRLSDPGVTVDLQGDSVGEFANGIVVTYPDVDTGRTEVITPDDNSALADTSVTNPANTHGIDAWTELTISSPTNSTGAVQHGRAVLAETNQPKAPGTIHATGHIRDRAGHWQQAWKVRAGDRIIISDHPNDQVRLVVETDYNHGSKTVSIAVDSAFMRVDAVQDRIVTALQAANLT